MTWSLSNDDDGLEGISSPQPHTIPLPDPGSERRVGFVQPRGPDTGPSIVVEPELPVQSVPAPVNTTGARRALEPTLVLKTRRLDELRDEVHKRRISHNRKKAKALILWGVAGGMALWLGVLAARTVLSPDVEDESATVESEALPSEAAARVRNEAPPIEAADKQESEAAPPTAKGADKLPTSTGAARGAAKSGGEVLTLEDLPTE